ncbi:MAG TPA: response regulator [Kofleriaceae bacterium]|nr:response regulator [Kofleriaceae bacterium]
MVDRTPPPELLAAFEQASREVGLFVDASGAIQWIDARGERLGLAGAKNLVELVVPGCEDKARELCRQGCRNVMTGWELPLVIGGKPATGLFSARPCAGGAALLASLIAQDYADAIAEGNRAVYEIVALNRELARQKLRLEESNTAIRALHGELAQHADRLRTAAEVKSRLVAGVSHEFRTPLHSILGLSRLLLIGSDGPLNSEQETQVRFIRDSAEELSRMINDMLDLSRLDAGSAVIRAASFELRDFFAALRGTMNPLVADDSPVRLVFDPPPDVALETDQGKLAQIMRNLISNALKFTRRGAVQVSATVHGDELALTVRDSGIGIAPADHSRVFEEFTQLDSPLQRQTRGTGLGLPLAKKLAESLGGGITLDSTPNVGSTFTVTLPMEHADIARYRKIEESARELDPARAPVLVVEDDRSTVFVYERYLSMAGFQVLPVRTTGEARAILARVRPSAILLDVMLEGEDTWSFLADVKRNPATSDIPVLVCTVMNRESRARALGADEFWLKPVDEDRLIRKLSSLAAGRGAKVLVVDDEPAARYIIQRFLKGTPYELIEASTGAEAVDHARSQRPDVILLDFLLEEMTAFDVIDQLKADPRTRGIPVIIVTSHALPAADLQRLSASTEAILSKEHLSRELAITRIRDALHSAGISSDGAVHPTVRGEP